MIDGKAMVKPASLVSNTALFKTLATLMRAWVVVEPFTVQPWLPSLAVLEKRVVQDAPPSRESLMLTLPVMPAESQVIS